MSEVREVREDAERPECSGIKTNLESILRLSAGIGLEDAEEDGVEVGAWWSIYLIIFA